ncbi:Nn.00g027480.m01.CDS01 [Neocucurbitaria sp. VM-36]
MLAAIDNPAIASNFRATTWILLGGIAFQLLASILGLRITITLASILLLSRLIPAIMISRGSLQNPELETVIPGKTAVLFPTRDGSSSQKPASQGIAVLILGVKISHPLGLFAPGAKQTGDFFFSLVKDLNEHPTENGWLGGSTVSGHPTDTSSSGHLSIIGYFKTMDDLHKFAHGPAHREAWNWWNANAGKMPYIGVYHEAYDVPAHHWETVYLQTPRLGLGATRIQDENGEWKIPLVDASKGVWRSSAGRMGRNGGETASGDLY